jgi:Ca-activated chloride channel family protein
VNIKAVEHRIQDLIGDFVELIAKAFFGGLGVAVAMSLAVLAFSSGAQAAKLNDAKAGQLLLSTDAGTAPDAEFTVAPQVSTEIAIDVTGMVARTRVTQFFHNPGSEFVEGVYVFPLPEKAAVDRLWMKIGDRVIEGRIREKEAARKEYEKAKGEGKKASIVVQQRPNLFTNTVAHIGPNDMVEIRIEYQQTRLGQRRVSPAHPARRSAALCSATPPPDEPKALRRKPGPGNSAPHPEYACECAWWSRRHRRVIDAGSAGLRRDSYHTPGRKIRRRTAVSPEEQVVPTATAA